MITGIIFFMQKEALNDFFAVACV